MGINLKRLSLVASVMFTAIATSSQVGANGVTFGFDTSFGAGGVVTHSLPFTDSSTESIDGFIDANGRLVSLVNFNVSESEIEEFHTGFVLARHTPQGELDTSFGVDGMTPPVSGTISTALVVLPNGNIVVSGLSFFVGLSMHAFTSAGELVDSFGVNGRVTIATPDHFSREGGEFFLDVQGNKLIASIRTDAPSSIPTTFIRSFTFDGEIDTSYGNQGVVNLQTNAVQNFAPVDTEVTNDGQMLLLGNAMLPPTQEQIDNSSPAMFAAVVIRLTSNGSIDTSFANYGSNVPGYLVIPPSGTNFIEGMRIAVSRTEVPADSSYGKFVVAGQSGADSVEDTTIFFSRFMANGMPDTGFGASGTLATNIAAGGNSAFVFDMHLAATGEVKAALIVVRGSPRTPQAVALFITQNGNSRAEFGTQLGVGAVRGVARILLEPTGTLIMLASTDVNGSANVYVRIGTDGVQHMNYGNDAGLATVDVEYNAQYVAWTTAFKADNGYTYLGGMASGLDTDGDYATSWLVVRLTSTGSIDPTFGVNGYGFINNMPYGYVRKINVMPDGKVYVLGIVQGIGGTLAGLGRLNANGSIDTTFGDDNRGAVQVAAGAKIYFNPTQFPIDMIVQDDNRVVVVGTIDSDNEVAFMQRFNDDGTLDTSFDGASGSANGFVQFSFAGDRGFNLVQQHLSGGYLVAGQENGVPFIGRITTAGVFDTTFEIPASPGMRPIETRDGDGALRNGEVLSMTQMPDGAIVAAGWLEMSEAPGNQNFLARFDSNGVYATGFDGLSGTSNGLVVLGTDPLYQEVLTGLMLLSDGSMVMAGSRSKLNGMNMPDQTGFFLFAHSDGRIHTEIGENGYLIVGNSSNLAGFLSLISTGDNEWIGVGFAGNFLRLSGIVARIMLSGTPVVPVVPPIADVPVVVPNLPEVVAPVADVAVTTPVKAVPKLIKPVVVRKKSVTRTTLMKYMKLTMPKGAKVTITVSPKSKRFCALKKTSVVYVRPGKCSVQVTVKPKKGKSRSAHTVMVVKK